MSETTGSHPRTHRTGAAAARLATAAVVVGLSGLALWNLQLAVVGQFHDDGIYLVLADALAHGEDYRLTSLPTEPFETKYPWLYPYLLSWVWRLAPEFPQNLVWLKAIGVLAFGTSLALAAVLYRRLANGADWGMPAVAFLIGSSPLVFPLVDLTLTDLPFFALCLAALVIAKAGAPAMSFGWRQGASLGFACGLAFLLRQAAAPLTIAAMLALVAARLWPALVAFGATVGILILPWLAFRFSHPIDPALNPLLRYYVEYEPSAIDFALRGDPRLALDILIGNSYYTWQTLDAGLQLHHMPALRFLVYPTIAWGLWRLLQWAPFFRRRRANSMSKACLPGFVSLSLALYLALVLLWPFHPGRYLLPLSLLMPVALVTGTKAALRPSMTLARSATERRLAKGLALLPLTLTVVLAISSLSGVTFRNASARHAASSTRPEHEWRGLEETFTWVRNNTAPTAVLATAYDPSFYLHTGRQGVRPWFHRPETLFYPVGTARGLIGPSEAVRDALDELGADYLVTSPLSGYTERAAASELFTALLAEYSGEDYLEPPSLLFRSSDGLHKVYRLPRRRAGGPTVRRAPALP